MGMFDWVSVPAIHCPYCEKEILENSGWQTKDDENVLATIPFTKETVGNFYIFCPHCEKFIEYARKKDFPVEKYIKEAYELVSH